MEQEKNKNGVIIFLVALVVILAVLCVLFATGTISLKANEVTNRSNNQPKENANTGDNSTDSLNSNIIVTQNGKVISNEIPSEIAGKYINPDSKEDYFEISNDNIMVSRSNCTDANAITIEKSQLKVYIDYLGTIKEYEKYITIKFDAIDAKTNEVMGTYVYIGHSSFGEAYKFKTIDATCTSGEGYFYEKVNN